MACRHLSLKHRTTQSSDLYWESLLLLSFHLLSVQNSGRTRALSLMSLPSEVELPGYYLAIKDPMDFNRIKTRLDHQEYTSHQDLIQDLRLVLKNAKRYHPRGTLIYRDATALLVSDFFSFSRELVNCTYSIPLTPLFFWPFFFSFFWGGVIFLLFRKCWIALMVIQRMIEEVKKLQHQTQAWSMINPLWSTLTQLWKSPDQKSFDFKKNLGWDKQVRWRCQNWVVGFETFEPTQEWMYFRWR